MINKKVASEIAVGIVLLIAVVVGGIFWIQNKNTVINNPSSIIENQEIVTQKPVEKDNIMCTQDAKLCDDGKTYVSRTGPKCEFAQCSTKVEISDWKNVEFDACGNKDKYENFSWWHNFIEASEKFNYYSDSYVTSVLKSYTENEYSNPEKIQYTQETYCSNGDDSKVSIICGEGRSRKLSVKDFAEYGEGCLSKDGSKFIAVFPGEYMGGGNYIFRYDIKNSILEDAQKIDQFQAYDSVWIDPPSKFGKRMGIIIKMTGGSGDAGCGSDTKFDFNIVDNTLKMTSRCTKCEGEKERCENF